MANAKKILVVDDDPDIVEQVTMILKQDGHEVHSAGTQNAGLLYTSPSPRD